MRAKIIAANWKMNKLPKDVEPFFAQLSQINWKAPVEAVIFPQTLLAGEVSKQVEKWSEDKGNLSWGAQNIYFEKSGAFTGENSIEVFKSLHATWVLIGHSERRAIFGESDEWLHKKLQLTLQMGLRPMLCVGESLAERESGQTLNVVEKQIINGVKGQWSDKLAIAYEPVWAIGTGKTATAEQAQEVHAVIRKIVAKEAGQALADNLSILYGGSVKPENAKSIMSQPDVDGLLVGGASLDAGSFGQLIRA